MRSRRRARLQAKGLLLTLDYLGESVTTTDQATSATREYIRLIDDIVAANIERNVSLKLSQLGLVIDRATCVDNMRRILEPARQHEFFVRIDMESSAYTEVTLEVFETLWNLEYRNIGVVLQSCLYRTERDLRKMNEIGARVRLVKGAYREPASVAYQQKEDVDAAYLRQMRLLVDHGTYPAFATHDVALLDEIKSYAAERELARDTIRISDAVRHQAGSAGIVRRRRISHARLRAVRARVVSLFHATARRTASQCLVRDSGDSGGEEIA